MKIGEARKGLRVRLVDSHYETRPTGSLTSGRIKYSQPPYEEGLLVRVRWDGMPTPEYWHLVDLAPETPHE